MTRIIRENIFNLKRWLVIVGLFSLVFVSQIVLAESEPISNFEAIPGQTEGDVGPGRTTDFIAYLEMLYRFGIAVAIILAIFMVSFGAFTYIVTAAGNASKVADAKSIITDAIIGLIMALTAWLILFVINPDLVRGISKQKIDNQPSLPPDFVCAGQKDGSNGIEGRCSHVNGKSLVCWKGKCEYICYDDAGNPKPDGTPEVKCGTSERAAIKKCVMNDRGESNCSEIYHPSLGKPCGANNAAGGYQGECKFPVAGSISCGQGETVTTQGAEVCKEGTICCVRDKSYEISFDGICSLFGDEFPWVCN